jgi:hypothetical protein
MAASELDEIVGELYLVPPTDFVSVRNDLVRQARSSGNRGLAEKLQSLRRPTQSAWLVNVLASTESAAMKRLSALGRELRGAQTGLDGGELRMLSEQRRQLITDLLDRARSYAADAGVRVTDSVLSEVEATLRFALVDLAGSFTVRSGRLVRPLAHNGFGPRPQVDVAPAPLAVAEPGEIADPAEWVYLPMDDELAARRRSRTGSGQVPGESGKSRPAPEQERAVQRATAELAAAESAHWQREHDLADAQAALEAATDRLDWLDAQRMEARRDKVTAENRLAEALAQQRDAIQAVADARQRLEIARRHDDAE